jgi:undecaprenyl-phosphate 4-deoxy-4-formamido-L-arabinose transferase
MNMARPALSIVVPLYNSASTLPMLIEGLTSIPVHGGLEIVLVNDGSRDATEATALKLIETASVPITFICHSRNFGEHNAVLAGLRASTGEFVITMDDDMQNPPSEVPKLLEVAQRENRDVVYTIYDQKKHACVAELGQLAHERLRRLEHRQTERAVSLELPLHVTARS